MKRCWPADVAQMLSRSKAWVSMRRGLLAEMSQTVQDILFRGAFPVYSYMATLRPFMRMKGVGRSEIERFVQAVAGQRLSVREIELLAHGYFRGPDSLRAAIDQGKWKWTLDQMRAVPEDCDRCNEFERKLLKELERLLKSMQRVVTDCDESRLQSQAFHAQANLLVASLLSRRDSFFTKLEECTSIPIYSSGCTKNAMVGYSACMKNLSRKSRSKSPTPRSLAACASWASVGHAQIGVNACQMNRGRKCSMTPRSIKSCWENKEPG